MSLAFFCVRLSLVFVTPPLGFVSGEFCAPSHEGFGGDVLEARPAGFFENFSDAVVDDAGVGGGFASGADVGGVFGEEVGEFGLRGFAVAAGGEEADGGALFFGDEVVEEFFGGEFVGESGGDFAGLVAAMNGVAR